MSTYGPEWTNVDENTEYPLSSVTLFARHKEIVKILQISFSEIDLNRPKD